VTKEQLENLYKNEELQRYIMSQSAEKTRIRDVREDCAQYAWMQIFFEPAGMDVVEYKRVAKRAINTEYNRYWRYWNWRKQMCKTADEHILGVDHDG